MTLRFLNVIKIVLFNSYLECYDIVIYLPWAVYKDGKLVCDDYRVLKITDSILDKFIIKDCKIEKFVFKIYV